MFQYHIILIFLVFSQAFKHVCNDDVENFLCEEDIEMFESLMTTSRPERDVIQTTESSSGSSTQKLYLKKTSRNRNRNLTGLYNNTVVPTEVDCFGLGWLAARLRWMFNLSPQSSEEVDVKFYLSTRNQATRMQLHLGDQFGLEWTDYDPNRIKTVLIVHGFLSHGSASWVLEMTQALLDWEDVNVLVVDWSAGGNSWKYWRAVANTRRVGADVTSFMRQLLAATNGSTKKLHLIGHSLGAHICSYIAVQLGGVARITGLDPAQPCFRTSDLDVLLDETDADFVDVIHTNGRLQTKIGLGLPEPCGHADFYPNGGMKQPGCFVGKKSFLSKMLPISRAKLERAICSHGRAYMYFTESLQNKNCSFIGHKWNMTYYGAKFSLEQPCTEQTCTELGMTAVLHPAKGNFFVITSDQVPFCVPNPQTARLKTYLFSDWRPEKSRKQEQQEEEEEIAEQNLFDNS